MCEPDGLALGKVGLLRHEQNVGRACVIGKASKRGQEQVLARESADLSRDLSEESKRWVVGVGIPRLGTNEVRCAPSRYTSALAPVSAWLSTTLSSPPLPLLVISLGIVVASSRK
jgi:hypothetical protein